MYNQVALSNLMHDTIEHCYNLRMNIAKYVQRNKRESMKTSFYLLKDIIANIF